MGQFPEKNAVFDQDPTVVDKLGVIGSSPISPIDVSLDGS